MDAEKKIEIEIVAESIFSFYETRIERLDKRLNKAQSHEYVWPRQVFEFFLKCKLNIKLYDVQQITGVCLGTILHSCRVVQNEIDIKSKDGIVANALIKHISWKLIYRKSLKKSFNNYPQRI